MTIFASLESSINKSFKSAKIETRPKAGHGLWIIVLIPLCLCTSVWRFRVGEIYRDTAICSVGLGLASIFYIFSVSKSKYDVTSFHGCIVPTIVTSVLQIIISQNGTLVTTVFSVVSGMASCYAFQETMMRVLKHCPKSFTLGEALLVVQAMVLFLYSAILNIQYSFMVSPENEIEIITLILQVGMMAVFYVVTTFCCLAPAVDLITFCIVVLVHVLGMLGTLHLLIGQSPLPWLINFLFDSWSRIIMIGYWVSASILCVYAVAIQTSSNQKASTSCRKIFHVLAVLVFIPGIIIDYSLIYLATGIAFAALIALETVRILKLGVFSDVLNDAFNVFSDEKDAGGLSLTPLYLLAGMSCPIWLESQAYFSSFAGVLSVGIGDTVASFVGSRFGGTKWPGSNKSYEGTLGNISAQLFIIYMLTNLGILHIDSYGHFIGLIAVFVNSIVEATTDQVDNLTLPLLTHIILILA